MPHIYRERKKIIALAASLTTRKKIIFFPLPFKFGVAIFSTRLAREDWEATLNRSRKLRRIIDEEKSN